MTSLVDCIFYEMKNEVKGFEYKLKSLMVAKG